MSKGHLSWKVWAKTKLFTSEEFVVFEEGIQLCLNSFLDDLTLKTGRIVIGL